MSGRRAGCVAFLAVCGAACEAPLVRHVPARPQEAPVAARALPRASGQVSVTFMAEDGAAAWGPWGEPTSDAAAAGLPCYTRALAEEPSLSGWIRVRVPGRHMGGYGASSFLDSSALPKPLIDCVVAALRTLEAPEGLEGPTRVAYVTLY